MLRFRFSMSDLSRGLLFPKRITSLPILISYGIAEQNGQPLSPWKIGKSADKFQLLARALNAASDSGDGKRTVRPHLEYRRTMRAASPSWFRRRIRQKRIWFSRLWQGST